ncbi:MAG TPA: DNA polymerase III subunit delta [Gemmataceae bacterium]|nr:DNA polymerase III subunit delta [Gemmataceae bacterium]
MDSLTFLERGGRTKPLPVYVLPGDEDFLKRRVLAALKALVLGEGGDEFGLSTHPGDRAAWAAVHDELQTLPFLSPRRLVVIENADPFVTRHRSALEKYVAQPAANGVLVLDVKNWPASTRLAKLLDNAATITCKALPAHRLPEWCAQWAAARHGKQLAAPAAKLLVDLVGPDMGLLDQELAKLAVYVGDAKRIDSGDVDRLVGNSRAESTWKIFDAIAAGRPGDALALLDRLFDQGEEPLRMLGAFSLQLRRLAQAYRRNQQGVPLPAALEQAGVPPFGVKAAEQQMRHLGRRRLERLHDWLVETDLGLKGGSQLPPRTLLERFVVNLARPPAGTAARG